MSKDKVKTFINRSYGMKSSTSLFEEDCGEWLNSGSFDIKHIHQCVTLNDCNNETLYTTIIFNEVPINLTKMIND